MQPLPTSELGLVVALAIALLTGVLIGGGIRQFLGRRTHLSWPASILAGIVGAFLGTLVVVIVTGGPGRFHPVIAFLAAIIGTGLVMWAATRWTQPPERTADELVAGGESATVEFKSTARWNLHTGKRDEKLELVIAKTVAAFANSDGGSLVIGVSDDGEPLGLADDLTLMKYPDTDRFELWLRDWLSQTLGAATTTTLQVEFPTVSGQQVCLVRIPASARPVFLVPGKGDGPQLWVRVGNSTRQLPLDQALSYASDRFGRRGLRAR